MKLALVIFRYFPFGGLQRDMLAIAQAAQARGHQVTIFCGEWQGDKVAGIDVVVIKGAGFFNVAGVKHFVTAFQQQFQRNQFDLTIGFNKMPGLDVYFAGDTCFAHKAYTERHFIYRCTPRASLYLAYERAVFDVNSDTHILSLVAGEQKNFARYYATPPERFHAVPPGISIAHIACADSVAARIALRRELGLSADTRIVLCLGSGFKTKGVDISIQAFAELTKISAEKIALVVVGSDDPALYSQQAYKAGVASLVFFLGPRNPVGNLLHAADVLLHPARKELAGNVLLESMLCAVPVVAAAHCGYAPYVIQYQMGELISPGASAKNIAQQVQKILSVETSVWASRAAFLAQHSDVFSRMDVIFSALDSIFFRLQKTQLPVQQCIQTADEFMVVRDELVSALQGQDIFSAMENMPGSVAREMVDRQTLRFEINGHGYYRKWHRGVGWAEIFKNLLQLRLPVLGASNEWDALNKLRALNVPSLIPLAYGVRGKNPARQQSFIVTRELANVIQLDHLFEQHSVDIKTRRRILTRVAVIARELHAAGINHRDFYLCHFMLSTASLTAAVPDIYLVDLHRAQLRIRVPERWQVKDLGGLLFSSLNLGFGWRDYWCFMRTYFAPHATLRVAGALENKQALLARHEGLIEKIVARARATYRRDFGHEPLWPGNRNR